MWEASFRAKVLSFAWQGYFQVKSCDLHGKGTIECAHVPAAVLSRRFELTASSQTDNLHAANAVGLCRRPPHQPCSACGCLSARAGITMIAVMATAAPSNSHQPCNWVGSSTRTRAPLQDQSRVQSAAPRSYSVSLTKVPRPAPSRLRSTSADTAWSLTAHGGEAGTALSSAAATCGGVPSQAWVGLIAAHCAANVACDALRQLFRLCLCGSLELSR